MRRALAVLAATAGAVAVWVVSQLAGAELHVKPIGQAATTVGWAAVLITVLVVGVAGWGLLALLERLTSRATTIWTWTAVAVLLLSLAGPLTVEEATNATRGWLIAMHATVAAILIPMLRATARRGKS
jgi:Family of unknown function (DUF6069)